MVVTRIYCDFCDKEMDDSNYIIDVRYNSGVPSMIPVKLKEGDIYGN